MRKTRLVIQPKRCLHTIGFLLLYLSCPVIGDWGRIQPDTDMSHRAVIIEREGSRTLMKDPPLIRRQEIRDRFTTSRISYPWSRALETTKLQRDLTSSSRRTEGIEGQRMINTQRERRWLDARNQRLSTVSQTDVMRGRLISRTETVPDRNLGRNVRLETRRNQDMLRRVPETNRRDNHRRLLLARSTNNVHEGATREELPQIRGNIRDESAQRRLLRERNTLVNNRRDSIEARRSVPSRQSDSTRRLLAARKETLSDESRRMVTDRREIPQNRRLLLVRSASGNENRNMDGRREGDIRAERRQTDSFEANALIRVNSRREETRSRSSERSLQRREARGERHSLPLDVFRSSDQSRTDIRDRNLRQTRSISADNLRSVIKRESRLAPNKVRFFDGAQRQETNSRIVDNSIAVNIGRGERQRTDSRYSLGSFRRTSIQNSPRRTTTLDRNTQRHIDSFDNERKLQSGHNIRNKERIDGRQQTRRAVEIRSRTTETRRRIDSELNRRDRFGERKIENSLSSRMFAPIERERGTTRNSERSALLTGESSFERRERRDLPSRDSDILGSLQRSERRDSLRQVIRTENLSAMRSRTIPGNQRKIQGVAQTNIRIKRETRASNLKMAEVHIGDKRSLMENIVSSEHNREETSRRTLRAYRTHSNGPTRRETDSILSEKPYLQSKVAEMFADKSDKWSSIKDVAANCVLGAVVLFLTSRSVKSAC